MVLYLFKIYVSKVELIYEVQKITSYYSFLSQT